PDARGVDVALLYLPIRFRLLGHESRRVPSVEHGLPPTRDILHCWGRTPAADTLHVVVCHLPSKGGGLDGQRNRELAVQTLVSLVDSLGPTCRLMVMGDFNADPFDRLFRRLPTLTDLAPRHRYPAVGSYFFRGRWSWIDHILLSASLSHGALRSVSAPWWQDGTATGFWKPRRTYLGKGYHGGVSDHLPVVVSLPL
ncbi:MAG: endonuclease/exonuclease/phosphatase family protein, partial [Bacteroidaceae bacterium]|nr:endonuclease/exonuclease/phosphatase family protein [Bacteroidaceae bacterium]